MSIRTAFVTAWIFLAAGGGFASTALLRSSAEGANGLATVQTPLGSVSLTISPVPRPSMAVTILILADSLADNELATGKSAILKLCASLRGRPLRIAVLQNGSLGIASQLPTCARVRAALDQVHAGPPLDNSQNAGALLDTLALSTQKLEGNWSRVLLIGKLPVLSPAATRFASALLLRNFGSQHIRLSWLDLSHGGDAWLPLFRATSGDIFRNSAEEFATAETSSMKLFELDWILSSPVPGFLAFSSTIIDAQGAPLLEVPDIALSSGATALSVAQYLVLEARVADARTLLENPHLTPQQIEQIERDLQAAFAINPSEPDALVVAISLAEFKADHASASAYAKTLVQLRPDGQAYALLGHALLLNSDIDEAEAAIKRALGLNAESLSLAEDLMRIHLARKDENGALPYLKQVIAGDPKRQDLWFLQAKISEHLQEPSLAVSSLEQALGLGGFNVSERSELIRLYFAQKEDGKALALINASMMALPSDAAVRRHFAATLDQLSRPAEAIVAWKKLLEVQPDSEQAYVRIARLQLEGGDARASEQTADDGISKAPKCAELYLVKADAEQQQGRLYVARATLRSGAEAVANPALLARLASIEDTYSSSAAEAYSHLADVLEPSSTQRLQTLQRGFAVSVRDGDWKSGKSFASSLATAGHPEFRHRIDQQENAALGTLIPGGQAALAFVARLPDTIEPDRFFTSYCASVANESCLKGTCGKEYLTAIDSHFQRIAALQPFGTFNGSSLKIMLSMSDPHARERTQHALEVLGIKLRSSKQEIQLQRGEKKPEVSKQETASALAIDEVSIQQNLQNGKTAVLEIPYERVPVYPSEKFWRDAFYPRQNEFAGFALSALHNPHLAMLYVAFSSMDAETIKQLTATIDIKTLADRYSSLLFKYSPSLALEGGHVAVPGGGRAEAVWTQMAGASPATPGAFFRALLEKDNGKMLAFFYTLSQLDLERQIFFTQNLSRARKFYDLFPVSQGYARDSTAIELMQTVPLDEQGHLDFPGSPEVWTLVKGRSTNEQQTAKMLKKLSKAAAPEVEDEVLIRLAQTRYKDRDSHFTELQNFMSVSRIDAHRSEQPLDEESALLLAQHYIDYSGAFAYFTEITAVQAEDFRRFFAAVEHIRLHPPMEADLQLGAFHGLIEWICLARREEQIDDKQAAKLLRELCDRFASADAAPAISKASLDIASLVLGSCRSVSEKTPLSERLRNCILGSNPTRARRRDFDLVLSAQKVPELNALFSMSEAINALKAHTAESLETLQKRSMELPEIELPKTTKLNGKEKDRLHRYDLEPVRKIIAQLSSKLSKRKIKEQDIEGLATELLGALQPQITLALAGAVYGYYFRSTDLVVSDDPLLLRKHRYWDFDVPEHRNFAVEESEFEPSSEGEGSYFVGGFGKFGFAAAEAATISIPTSAKGARETLAMQIAAIRSTPWDRIKESDQRLLNLRVAVAREWICESAHTSSLRQALMEESAGILSLARRADLLNGIESEDWHKVWRSVTLADLFALGGRYLRRFKSDPWTSPVTEQLRATLRTNDGSRLQLLGPIAYRSFGCAEPDFRQEPPYEEYEHGLPPEMGERTAEFKFYLAHAADVAGIDPSELGDAAEPLALKIFDRIQLSDYRDWKTVIAGYSSLTPEDLTSTLHP